MGGGIIGLSLSIALRKRGAQVLVVERGEPGREASYAAGGMIADSAIEIRPALQSLATASARMYPEFVHELEDESGVDIDLRDAGTLLFPSAKEDSSIFSSLGTFPAPIKDLEPELADLPMPAVHLKERSVDPRALVGAALKAAKHRAVDISSGTAVSEIVVEDGRVSGVRTDKTTYHASVVVNCAGAWSGKLPPHHFPTRPVKGQMLAVASSHKILHHVIRRPEVYLIPRSDRRIIIGTTVEEVGYEKNTNPEAIHRLHEAAVRTLPALADARILEAWAGLRPGTPDSLPILGATPTLGYFAATGHYRDGILLAPVTALVMTQLMTGGDSPYDISAFSPARFEVKAE